MKWRDDLRRVTLPDGRRLIGASFRGVPFFVDTAERTGGRRAVVHEFPLRDDPFIEDLGRKARTFKIDGYVIGDDYLPQRDALLSALEDEEGPGQLVHPYYGTKRAICVSLTTRETKADGGMATFAIEFAETPAQAPTPAIAVDSVGVVAASADAAQLATDTQFQADYDAAGLPSFALASAQTAIKGAAAALSSTLGPAVKDTQELAGLNSQLTLIAAQAQSLAAQPATLLTQMRTAISGLVTTVKTSPGAVFDALVRAYGAALGTTVIATTATRLREALNQAAITGALRRVMAIEAARLAPVVPFVTIEDATAARDQVAAQLDEQAQTAGDTVYPALVDLRSQVLRAVPGSSVFARVVTVARPVAIPSLLLAYQLYGSVDLELDVVARNRVRHPGFIAGDLKVLSNG